MTAQEMKYEFLVGYDRVTNQDAPGFIDPEISVFLTKAQQRFILTKYSYKGNNNNEGFEFTEKRRKELNELIENATLDSASMFVTSDNKPNAFFVSLPDNFMLAINEECDVQYTNCNGISTTTRSEVVPIREDEYNKAVKNPFKKPCKDLIWRMDYSSNAGVKRHEIIADSDTTVSTYYLRYIKYPLPIITGDLTQYNRTIDGYTAVRDCELSESTHRDIIDLAITIALETIEDNRLQSNIVVNNENE